MQFVGDSSEGTIWNLIECALVFSARVHYGRILTRIWSGYEHWLVGCRVGVGWVWPDRTRILLKTFLLFTRSARSFFWLNISLPSRWPRKWRFRYSIGKITIIFPGAFITWHAVAERSDTDPPTRIFVLLEECQFSWGWDGDAKFCRFYLIFFCTRGLTHLSRFCWWRCGGGGDGTTRWRGCEWARHNGTHDLIGGLIFRITLWMVHLTPHQT